LEDFAFEVQRHGCLVASFIEARASRGFGRFLFPRLVKFGLFSLGTKAQRLQQLQETAFPLLKECFTGSQLLFPTFQALPASLDIAQEIVDLMQQRAAIFKECRRSRS
jgi:hypothetical protein